jgi:hypothetical protein
MTGCRFTCCCRAASSLLFVCVAPCLQPLRDYLTGKLAHTVHISDVVPTVTFSALEPAAKKQKLDGETAQCGVVLGVGAISCQQWYFQQQH